jgi:hypothetical protein
MFRFLMFFVLISKQVGSRLSSYRSWERGAKPFFLPRKSTKNSYFLEIPSLGMKRGQVGDKISGGEAHKKAKPG